MFKIKNKLEVIKICERQRNSKQLILRTHGENLNEQKKNTKFKRILKRIFIIIFILGIIACSIVLFLLYGPWNGFRDWLITTAMSTMHHQYLATWFYSEETIQECLDRNRIIQVTGITDESLIQFIDYSSRKDINYKNEYERQVLEKDKNNNDYKIVKIDEKNFKGYMAVIYDPSRIGVVAASEYGEKRQYLTEISKKTNSLVAINAGGFAYASRSETTDRDTAYPLGVNISGNKVITNSQPTNIIGFNKNHKLILGTFSTEEAIANNIRDCVSFEPYLILNGEKSTVLGNGGWGKSSRTAIGQRADGIVLFLVLDGNRALGHGATMTDLINIFDRYGAINAANLDGGTSTSMTVKGKTINLPLYKDESDIRTVPTAFILKPDDSDNGDYSVVADKVDN